jgi:hypothetical protein
MRAWAVGLTVAALLAVAVPGAAARRWRLVPTPMVSGQRMGQLSAVSCPSAFTCTAVGLYIDHAHRQHNLAMRWNGMSWRIQNSPTPRRSPGFSGVSCPTVAVCEGGGAQDGIWAERYLHRAWRLQRLPGVGRSGWLRAVSCSSPSSCVAVGFAGPIVDTHAISEHWNGRRWRFESVPLPLAHAGYELKGIDCTSARDCMAVGDFAAVSGQGGLKVLAERWNGSRWRMIHAPSPAGSLIELNGISCVSASWCEAAGDYQLPNTNSAGLLEGWDGKHWRIQHGPRPPAGHGPNFELEAVSCVAERACTAVGAAFTNVPESYVLAERLTSRGWRLQQMPNPPGLGGELFGVSCTGGGCMAVGSQSKVTQITPILETAPPLQFSERFS